MTDAGPCLSTNNSPALTSRIEVLSTLSPSPSLDNLHLGEEAASSSDNSNRTIEALTITEYEGSPRRFGGGQPVIKSVRSQSGRSKQKNIQGEKFSS